jgi:hypothetical protein
MLALRFFLGAVLGLSLAVLNRAESPYVVILCAAGAAAAVVLLARTVCDD